MIDQAQTDKFRDILGLSKNTLVIFEAGDDLDLFLASYCLYLFLSGEDVPSGSSNGHKNDVRLLTPRFKQKLPKEIEGLIDSHRIETELGKENLIVSFPYQEDQVDKVSYFIGEHDQRFHLTIKPKRGVAPIASEGVEFSYAGTEADLLVLCGVNELEQLEQLYFAYENLYTGENNHVLTLNDHLPDFGSLNLDASEVSSYCEAVFTLISKLAQSEGRTLTDRDMLTLLLYGIEYKSQGLQSLTATADTFAVVAELLKLGARRVFRLQTSSNQTHSVAKSTARTKTPTVISPSLQQH